MHKYTRFDAQSFKDAMICTMDSIWKYMLEIILHQQRTPHLLKQKKLMQTQEDHSNPIRSLNVDSLKVDLVVIQNTCSETEDSNLETASSKSVEESSLVSATKDVKHFRDTLLQHMGNVKKSVVERARHQRQYNRRVNKRLKQTQESKIDTGKAVNDDLVVTESSGIESEVQDDNSGSGNDTDADDADIRPIYDEEPMAKVQLTAECNIFTIGQQHTEQPEIINKVLGKPALQPLRNQSVVRQPNAFKNERPQMSKQRFASQVDGNYNLSKPVTQHYLPKKSESAFAKPDHMIASSSSRNSSKNMPRFSSNDMVHNHCLDEAKKKTQERDSHSKTSEVNSSAQIQSHKKRDRNKPVDQKSHTQIPGRQIFPGHRFFLNKTSIVYEKISPRSNLRWKPTGRIFKSVGRRWLPTGKLFDSCISKVDSEPPHGSNVDISKIHECTQTLDLSAGTSINVQKEQCLDLSAEVPSTDTIVMTSMIDLESLFDPSFDEYFDGENQVVLKPSAVTTADTSDKRQQQPDSTSSTSSLATTISADGNFDLLVKEHKDRYIPNPTYRLLPYGLQQYLPDEVVKPIIELCSFFKQICSATLMVDDMLKAQSKVVNILCNLELIYPPAFFDIMIHLVIHLPLEALEGGPIRPRWMFSFERFMKKLKCYVFGSLCKSISLRLVIRFDAQELKKVIWYVLHNSPEIDMYRSQFKSKFPNKDMKEEFPDWFGTRIRQRHVDNDLDVSITSELFALACVLTPTLISVNSCVVNGVRFVVHSRDERRTTQNSGICSPSGKDEEINEGRKVKDLVLRNNMTQILTKGEAFKDDQYILATQVKQCFYLEDMARRQPHWKVVEHVNHKKFSDGAVIVVEEDPDVIHFDNSSDLALSTSLNDLDNKALHIDGQSTKVDAPPNIIDLDEDDDIIDDEDVLPHDLADSDNEDLVNVDDDGVDMSADVTRGHSGNGGGDDRKGIRKPNLGGMKAGGLHTRQETRNLGLKKITDDKGPVPIRFEWDDKKTLMPLGDHASHWSNYLDAIPTLDRYQSGHPAAPAKVVQYQQGFSQGSALVYKPRDRDARRREHQTATSLEHYPGGDVEAAGSRLQHPVGVLPGRATDVLIPPPSPPTQCIHNFGDVEKLKKKNNYLTKQREWRYGNDEMASDEDGGEDEEDEEDATCRSGKASSVALISLTETMWAPPSRSGKSPGKVSLASFPLQCIPGDMSPGITIPSDKSPGKAWTYRWGKCHFRTDQGYEINPPALMPLVGL
nr:hypothetical protein [Tanacetum cinerariifolium]